MKNAKKLLLVVLSIFMLLTSIPVFATNEVTPRYSNLQEKQIGFMAASSVGYVNVIYTGNPSTFSYAKLTVKVEKRFLLVFWNDVTEWTTTSSDVNGNLYNVLPLNGSGKYRATFTLEIYGLNGSVDTITETLESSY